MFSLFENPTLDSLLQENEGQVFDRKGNRINWTSLVNLMVGFANADGGVIVIGIEKDRAISGVENVTMIAQEVKKVATFQAIPPVSINLKSLSCKNFKKLDSNLLLVEVRQGTEVHSNQKDEVFLRIGKENRKLSYEQRILLLDDRGRTSFELTEAEGATVDDIATETFEEYKHILGLSSVSTSDLLLGRDLASLKNGQLVINMAGILLFGKKPERWVERARIRILKYEGSVERTGQDFNVVKDFPIYGPLPYQIKKTQEVLSGLFREFTTLDKFGKFITQSEYPDYAWKEAITNAVVHRSYVMRGADIQIKFFDDHLEVISPGRFPGPVNESNIKDTHYSRNPRIARVMSELGFVRELGEGVNRILREVKIAELPDPIFKERADSEVLVRFENNAKKRVARKAPDELHYSIDEEVLATLSPREQRVIDFVLEHGKITSKECAVLIEIHRATAFRLLNVMDSRGWLIRKGEKGPLVHYSLGPKLANKKNLISQSKGKKTKQTSLFE